MTLHGYAILSYKRERRKREGVLEPMYSGARDLTRSVLLRTLLEKRERGRKRGGLKPTFLETRELTQSGFYGLLMDQSAT